MHTLNVKQMDVLTGGSHWCGAAVGATVAVAIFFSPFLAGYMMSKAIGVCLIERYV